MHYSKKYQKRIQFLEQKIRDYYMANYEAKKMAGINPGVCNVKVLEESEEFLVIRDAVELKKIIEDLPLWDCGC